MGRLPFIDWMKAIGMLLIVYGHSSAGTHFFTTDPIFVKQLGVAFFVFVTGYMLARENRPTSYVVFSRLFGIGLYGFGFAIFMSIVGLCLRSDPAESNYLPFLAGANVFFNYFPANPTTWFIGTYLHLILLWAILLRRVQLRWWMLSFWIPVSVLARALFIDILGQYVAYMLVTNWTTLFLLGMLSGSRPSETRKSVSAWISAAGLAISLLLIWPKLVTTIPFGEGFPFRIVQRKNPQMALLETSALVELIYVLGTLVSYRLSLVLPRLRLIEFFARNTVVIFIFHMPLVYLLHPYVGILESGYVRVAVNVILYFVMLALLGEFLNRLLRWLNIQRACWARFQAIAGIA